MKGSETGARRRLAQAQVVSSYQPAAVLTLTEFLRSANRKRTLSKKERLRIVEQALLLLEMNYVHLPLKRAIHAVDPIQRLKLLKFQLVEMKEKDMPSEMDFHRKIMDIFTSTRDLHTLYLLPEPYKNQVAYLPFLVEQYFEERKGKRIEKFIVSRIVEDFFKSIPDPGPEVLSFERGVEALFWNGVPIGRAIEINGEIQPGSNPEARFARGLDSLTVRPLDSSLPPDETWVALTYRARDGSVWTLNQEWLVFSSEAVEEAVAKSKSTRKKRAAIDIKKTKINQLKRALFAPRDVKVQKRFEDVFFAEARTVNGKQFGYIRLFSFSVKDPDDFVEEIVRVIKSDWFPQGGLIIDVRGNGGGKIRAGERLLQLFTPHRVNPELFEFINTPLNLEICRNAKKELNLDKWADSIAEAVLTGAIYSSGFPINSKESCNDIGQIYYGPVVLITDALSYSTTDIFAAGFQDNEVGEVLGTSDNTGAGGANVWWFDDLAEAVAAKRDSPFKPLPRSADLQVALRRSIRVGRHAGRPLEELGIVPDHRHYMTKRDVLQRNEDLIKSAASVLDGRPIYTLSVTSLKRRGSRGVVVGATSKVQSGDQTKRISRLDAYVDGRPYKSFDAKNGAIKSSTIKLGKVKGKAQLRLEVYDEANNLVAAHRGLL